MSDLKTLSGQLLKAAQASDKRAVHETLIELEKVTRPASFSAVWGYPYAEEPTEERDENSLETYWNYTKKGMK